MLGVFVFTARRKLHKPLRLKAVAAGLAAVALLVIAGVEVNAELKPLTSTQTFAQTTLPLETHTGTKIVSNEITAEREFNAIGFTWNGSRDADFQVRFKQGQDWSGWMVVPPKVDIKNTDGELQSTDLFFIEPIKTFQYSYRSVETLENVETITISTKTPSRPLSFIGRTLSKLIPRAKADVVVITREQWGADEDVTYWEPEYTEPEKIIIHHTAGSDGGNDPEATVRAIHYWHAVVNGWGDIGYNYLIDGRGRVYEGRKGGDGAIGAHTFRNSTCNEQRFGKEGGVDFNRGTIGIAILGNYEENSVPEDAFAPLSYLIAEKAALFEIPPNNSSNFRDMVNLPNIIGHGDVDCTACPGEHLSNDLERVRLTSQGIYEGLDSIEPIAQGRLEGVTSTELVLDAGESIAVKADFENTGSTDWISSDSPTRLSLQSASSPSTLGNDSWLSGNTAATLITPRVRPGSDGRFEFTITAPSDALDITEEFYLASNGIPLADTRFSIRVNVTGLSWAARPSDTSVHEASFLGARLPTSVSFENAGTETWTRDSVRLHAYDLGYAASRYGVGAAQLKESSVKPGETGTFEFTETSPTSPGYYRQIFKLKKNETDVINSEVSRVTRVDSMFKARLVETNMPLAMLDNWRPTVTFKFKNTGVTTWNQNVQLDLFDLGNGVSRFRDSSWSANNGKIRLNENSVRPGEIGTFTVRLDTPKPGLYYNKFALTARNYPYAVQGSEAIRIIRVDPAK